MFFPLKYRSCQPELMDDPEADRVQLRNTLRYIDFSNRWLGGYEVLLSGLEKVIRENPEKKVWRILDVGCGGGDQLLALSQWAEKQSVNVQLSGLDNNPEVISAARLNSALDGFNLICADAMDSEFNYADYDLVCCTLFLHHLDDEKISRLFRLWNKSGIFVLINDLHRSRAAWILFNLFALITAAPSMARHDGALSVKKSFKRDELQNFAFEAGFKKADIQWKWAFRYQVLLGHDQHSR